MGELFQIRVCGISFLKEKLLLITHKKNNKEYWVVPGGRVEFGERAVDAIIREYKEELNLSVEVKEFLFYNESLPPDYPKHSLNLFFLLKLLNNNIKLANEPILGTYKLFKKNEIQSLELYPEIKKEVEKNFYIWLKKIL